MLKQFKYNLIIGVLFIFGGLLIGHDFIIRQFAAEASTQSFSQQITPVEAAKQEAVVKQPLLQGKPIRIVIPSLAIDLSVADGIYDAKNKSWTLSRDKAQYALMTPLANNKGGNTFIYGHALANVFGKLPQLRPNDTVTIYTDNGHTFSYIYTSVRETSPSDDSLFKYQGPPILTLQTCSGIFFENRQLFKFNLNEAK